MGILHNIADFFDLNLGCAEEVEPEEYGDLQKAVLLENPAEGVSNFGVPQIDCDRTPQRNDVTTTPVSSSTSTQYNNEIIYCQPTHFDDVADIICEFSLGKSILVNLDLVDDCISQRAIDYICGSMLALKGRQVRVGEKVFLFVNPFVTVVGNLDEIEHKGLELRAA